jgi:ribosomal protein S18 acetylase RimI-like enzyme
MSSMTASTAKYFQRRVIEDEQRRGWLDYRLAPGDTAEMVNIEVGRAHRRQGVGRALLARLIAELPPQVGVLYAFTSASNAIGIEWYRAMGFSLSPLPRFYASMNEDAFCCMKTVGME